MSKDARQVFRDGGAKNHWIGQFADAWSGDEESDAKELELHRRKICRDKCRDGNPWPLVAYQWPSLIIKDPVEAKFFEGEIGDLNNPCLRIDWWQRLGVESAFRPKYSEIFFKGNRGAGKTCIVGMVYNLYFDCYDTLKAHCTSANYAHTRQYLMGEVKSWRQLMHNPAPAHVLHDQIHAGEDKYIKIINPAANSRGEEFSGIHPKADGKVIFAFDESSAVQKLFYEQALDGANLIFAMSNPRTTIGWFRDAYRPLGDKEDEIGECLAPKGKRLCITVGGLDCANVKYERLRGPVGPPGGIEVRGKRYEQADEIPKDIWQEDLLPLIGGQIDLTMYRQIRNHPEKWWGDCFADGKFVKEDAEKQVILGSWLQRHRDAWKETKDQIKVEAFAYDAARSVNGDDNVLATGGVDGCREIIQWKCKDLTESCDKIIAIAQGYGIDLTLTQHPVVVDVVGVGAGAADILRKLGVWVIEHHAGMKSQWWPKECLGLRTETYHIMGRRLSPADYWGQKPWPIPTCEVLAQELTAPLKIYPEGDRSRFKLEPKDTVKTKLVSGSPDRADALVMLWYGIFMCNNYYEMLTSYQDELVTALATMSEDEKEEFYRDQGGALSGVSESPDLVNWIKETYGTSPKRITTELPYSVVKELEDSRQRSQEAISRFIY